MEFLEDEQGYSNGKRVYFQVIYDLSKPVGEDNWPEGSDFEYDCCGKKKLFLPKYLSQNVSLTSLPELLFAG